MPDSSSKEYSWPYLHEKCLSWALGTTLVWSRLVFIKRTHCPRPWGFFNWRCGESCIVFFPFCQESYRLIFFRIPMLAENLRNGVLCIQLHKQFCENKHFSWQKIVISKIKMQVAAFLLCVHIPNTGSAGKFLTLSKLLTFML